MRHCLLVAVISVFLPMSLGLAATVDLSDGSSIKGDILKQDSKSIQINVDGVTMTYYADEIKDIDGQPFGTPQASTPVAQPGTSVPSGTPGPAASAVDPQKRALILQFIDVFGTRQALNNNFDRMLAQIQKQKPEEAQKIRDRVKVDEIIERLIPIYDRNFTSEDLKAFIAFYGSPEGQKLIRTIPVLMRQSVQESIKYMREKFPETVGKQS
ncbi:MAG: DUF2059 domain-containing protein [Candidatus Omnitrophica bacterium]|nr:DUF2059 domain-containing protein [Candidatus Omnitrophota bacterium]